jgi:hypothetical protein
VFGIRLAAVVAICACIGCGKDASRQFSSICAGFDGRTEIGGDGTVAGLARFQKRVIASGGATGEVLSTPIRFAAVEVVGCESGTVLAAGATDGSGRYQIGFTNPGQVGVYVRVLSSAPAYAVSVKRSARQPALYGLASSAVDDSGAGEALTLPTLDAREGGEPAGAFNILDQGIRGGDVVAAATTGLLPDTPLQWYWFSGSTDGTSYDPTDSAISVSGRATDPDEFDDAVLLHEYGHYVLDVYSRDDSPGGPHSLGDATLDLRLAWSEGWATFFSSVVRNDPRHVDSAGSGVRVEFEIEGPALAATAVYDTNELSVAAVLWDVYDGANGDEGAGPLTIPFSQIWRVITDLSSGFTTVSFEDFWTRWQALSLQNLMPILALRSIDLWVDSFEGSSDDNVSSRAAVIGVDEIQHRTLYPLGDVDYAVFTPVSDGTYTVSTARCVTGVTGKTCDARLSNAADPVLDLTGVSLLVSEDNLDGRTYPAACGQNCPPNNADALSSRIRFSGTAGVPYVVKVARSPLVPQSAGDLGAYELVVTKAP